MTDTFPPEINGVATSSRNLAQTLRSHGNKVLVVTTNIFDNELNYNETEGIIRIPGLYLKKLYGYRLASIWNSKVISLLRGFRPDVIHIQTDGGLGQFGFLAAASLHCATVYTYHTMYEDYTYYATKGHLDRAARGIVRWFIRFRSNQATEFIAPSEKIRDYMRMIGVDSHVYIIPTGIEFEKFHLSATQLGKVGLLRRKFGLEGFYVLLSLGRVAKEKSIDVCLKGYAAFLKTNSDKPTKMLIVGGGPALDELKAYAASLGLADRVVFVGSVDPDEVPLYYHLGDVFVSASITETQGLTFMEAMASRLVILARYDDNLATTIKDGDSGYFFLNDGDFSEKLRKIISLSPAERKRIIVSAAKSVEPYSMENFYLNVEDVYRHAIKKNW